MTDLPTELPELELWQPIAVDTETNGLYADSGARVSVVSLSWVDPDILRQDDLSALRNAIKTGEGVYNRAFPFSQGPYCGPEFGVKLGVSPGDTLFGVEANPNLGLEEWTALMDWLADRPHVYHNGKFDVEKLRYAPIGWPGAATGGGLDFYGQWYWDTQVANPEFWPGETSSLKPTAAKLWGENSTAEADALKPHLGPKTDPRYDLVPWEVIAPYAAKDTELTIRLFYLQMGKLGLLAPDQPVDEQRYRHALKQIAVAKNLYRMERAGLPYDALGSREAASKLVGRVTTLEQQLPFRPTSAQAKAYLFGDHQVLGPDRKLRWGLGMQPLERTEKGDASLTADVIARIIRTTPADDEAHRVAELWAERTKLANAASKWFDPFADALGPDGRLRTCYRQVARGRGDEDGGTRSGRFSVERVNLQAIPHDYRLASVLAATGGVSPRSLIGQAAKQYDGWELWEFDLAQAELRLAAAWAGCTPMLSAFVEGRDLHSETTRELFKVEPDSPTWGMYRQIGKRANFTLCFGAGGETLAGFVQRETGVDMSADEGSVIVEQWNGLYPQFRAAIAYWEKWVEQDKSVPLASAEGFATGRQRVFDWDEDPHKGFNQVVQASLAEFAKDWNLQTEAICDDEGLGFVEGVGWTGLLGVIHDSQVMLLPAGSRGEAISKRLTDAAATLWHQFFGRPDPEGRVQPVDGYVEGKRW